MILSLLNHNPYGYDNSFSSFYYSVPLIVIHLLWSQLVFCAIVVGEEIVFLITISLLVDYSVDYFFSVGFLFWFYDIFVFFCSFWNISFSLTHISLCATFQIPTQLICFVSLVLYNRRIAYLDLHAFGIHVFTSNHVKDTVTTLTSELTHVYWCQN